MTRGQNLEHIKHMVYCSKLTRHFGLSQLYKSEHFEQYTTCSIRSRIGPHCHQLRTLLGCSNACYVTNIVYTSCELMCLCITHPHHNMAQVKSAPLSKGGGASMPGKQPDSHQPCLYVSQSCSKRLPWQHIHLLHSQPCLSFDNFLTVLLTAVADGRCNDTSFQHASMQSSQLVLQLSMVT